MCETETCPHGQMKGDKNRCFHFYQKCSVYCLQLQAWLTGNVAECLTVRSSEKIIMKKVRVYKFN